MEEMVGGRDDAADDDDDAAVVGIVDANFEVAVFAPAEILEKGLFEEDAGGGKV